MPAIPKTVLDCGFYNIWYEKHICISNVDCKDSASGFDSSGMHGAPHYLNLSNVRQFTGYESILYQYVGDNNITEDDKNFFGYREEERKIGTELYSCPACEGMVRQDKRYKALTASAN